MDIPSGVVERGRAGSAESSAPSKWMMVVCVDAALAPRVCHRVGTTVRGKCDRPSTRASPLKSRVSSRWAEFCAATGSRPQVRYKAIL